MTEQTKEILKELISEYYEKYWLYKGTNNELSNRYLKEYYALKRLWEELEETK